MRNTATESPRVGRSPLARDDDEIGEAMGRFHEQQPKTDNHGIETADEVGERMELPEEPDQAQAALQFGLLEGLDVVVLQEPSTSYNKQKKELCRTRYDRVFYGLARSTTDPRQYTPSHDDIRQTRQQDPSGSREISR